MKIELKLAWAIALLSAACSSDSSGPQQPGMSQDPSMMPVAGTAGSSGPTQQAGSVAPVASAGTSAGMSAAGGGAAGMRSTGRGVAGSAGGGTDVPAAGSSGGATGAAGMSPGMMQPGGPVALPECESSAPAEFTANPNVGGGGAQFKDSAHFRIYGASEAQADAAIKSLEAAYSCFVETLCWRSSGLSINGADSGPYSKMNIYATSLSGAAGQMFSDARAGLSYLKVVPNSIGDAKVTVHEYGHALTYHEKGWIDQTRTGAWWETVANFVADTYLTSPLCASARMQHGQQEGRTIIDLNKVIGDSHQVIVDATTGSGNYYQAWPLLTYITNNPDGYAGLGATVLRDMFRKHMRNNETPLHVLERIAAPIKVQQILGRYWARMAYADIGHKQAQDALMGARARLNLANLDAMGTGMYRVKANRQPRYFGANIIPLQGMGEITAQVTSSARFTATLAVRSGSGAVRYVGLENGMGTVTLESGEQASLVVVNTPDALVQYDPFQLSGDVTRGLDYTVQLTGAMPAN